MPKNSRKIKKFRNQTELTPEGLLLRALITGEPLTRDMALGIPAVQKAVNRISNSFAVLPFELYKEEKIDGKKKVTKIDDNRNFLINDETGDTLDAFQFKKALCEDYLLGKGGYAFINRHGNTIHSLNYVKCDSVSFTEISDPIYKSFMISCGGRMYKDFDFLKIIRSTSNGAYGKSLLSELEQALQTAFNSICYQLKLTKTAGIKRGFLQSQRKLGDEALEALKQAWSKMYSGDSENVIVLNDGVQFQPAVQTPYEMQLASIRSTLNKEIAEIFCDYEDDAKFYKYAILPIVTAFETACNKCLLLEKEKGAFYFAVDSRKLTQASMKERYEAYKVAKDTGWLGLNEIRYEEDREDVPGLDVIPMSLGSVLLDMKTGEYYVPNTGQTYSQGGE